MPLTLVTGPANSAKAAEVLGGVRAALDREPLLVVPTAADVDRYRRELAEGGIVFGVRVLRFAELIEEAARRAGQTGVPLGATARDRIVAAVAARTRLDVLAAPRATPGLPRPPPRPRAARGAARPARCRPCPPSSRSPASTRGAWPSACARGRPASPAGAPTAT